jgi:hypothetical protein
MAEIHCTADNYQLVEACSVGYPDAPCDQRATTELGQQLVV